MRGKTPAQLARIRAAEHARLAKYRNDVRTVTFEYDSGHDRRVHSDGSLSFLMYWYNEGYHLGARWWGQYYRTTDPDTHVCRWQAAGYTVREVNRPGQPPLVLHEPILKED